MDLVIHQHYAKVQAQAAHSGRITVLRIGETQTSLTAGTHGQPDALMVLPWGSHNLAATCFKGRMPSAMAMENAIMVVEDALMAARNPAIEQLPLHADDALLHRLAQVAGRSAASDLSLTLDDVERTFNLLADVAQGRPITQSGLPEDTLFAAYMLILRECMHHQQFAAIQVHT